MPAQRHTMLWIACLALACLANAAAAAERPNIVIFLADDQGWGDVRYQEKDSPLQTPVLDEMAQRGLRFDRFYAAAPVCSPTRGSLLTGRHPNRFGCFSWGYTLRPQESTLAEVLAAAGYATGHFGKWHLGPVDAGSENSPGQSGFGTWFSSPNFFENDPLMSHNGKVVHTQGEGSLIVVDAALEFIRASAAAHKPFLAVVWFGSPHTPHEALADDRKPYADHPPALQHYWGEITAMDRAVGKVRTQLRELGLRDNTLVWYMSDNGATTPGSTGGLRGKKGTLWEGGLRVPSLVEWPAGIREPRRVSQPCSTVDVLPTVLDLLGLQPATSHPLDGTSLRPIFEGHSVERAQPLAYWVANQPGRPVRSREILLDLERRQAATAAGASLTATAELDARTFTIDEVDGHAAIMDERFKLHVIPDKNAKRVHLYDLVADPTESRDLADAHPEQVARLRSQLDQWRESVLRSLNGGDYDAVPR